MCLILGLKMDCAAKAAAMTPEAAGFLCNAIPLCQGGRGRLPSWANLLDGKSVSSLKPSIIFLSSEAHCRLIIMTYGAEMSLLR